MLVIKAVETNNALSIKASKKYVTMITSRLTTK